MSRNIHYENREIQGERLELIDKEASYWLGPNLTLRGCTVVIGVSRRQFVLKAAVERFDFIVR